MNASQLAKELGISRQAMQCRIDARMMVVTDELTEEQIVRIKTPLRLGGKPAGDAEHRKLLKQGRERRRRMVRIKRSIACYTKKLYDWNIELKALEKLQ